MGKTVIPQVSPFRLLFPAVCGFCGEDLPVTATERLCVTCLGQLYNATQPRCRRCGGPLRPTALDTAACALCRRTKYRFDRAIAIGLYEGALKETVIRMKHANERYLTAAMGDLLADHALVELASNLPDLLLPVPMHWWRLLRRGGSSAERLALSAADKLGIPACPGILYCRRNPKKQSRLRPAERRQNVSGVFSIRESYDLVGAHVGLVDDTLTTGSTANELTGVLASAGVARVTVCVVARATGGR